MIPFFFFFPREKTPAEQRQANISFFHKQAAEAYAISRRLTKQLEIADCLKSCMSLIVEPRFSTDHTVIDGTPVQQLENYRALLRWKSPRNFDYWAFYLIGEDKVQDYTWDETVREIKTFVMHTMSDWEVSDENRIN